MVNQSIQHTRWNSTYHIVFIPRYRKKMLYGSNKKDVVEIIKKFMRFEKCATYRGESVSKSYSYVSCYFAPNECFRLHLISKRQKCPDVF